MCFNSLVKKNLAVSRNIVQEGTLGDLKEEEHALKNVNTEINPSEIFRSSMFWDNLRAIMSGTSSCNIY